VAVLGGFDAMSAAAANAGIELASMATATQARMVIEILSCFPIRLCFARCSVKHLGIARPRPHMRL